MKKFKIVVFCTCIILSIVLFAFGFYKVKTKIAEKKRFSSVKEDFEVCNEYFQALCSNDDNVSFDIQYTDGEITTITMYKDSDLEGNIVPLESKIIESLHHIYESAFTGGFDSVEITSSRISYGGMSNRLYVFSKSGKKPTYFYSENPTHEFSYRTYNLGDNWFLLKSRHIR